MQQMSFLTRAFTVSSVLMLASFVDVGCTTGDGDAGDGDGDGDGDGALVINEIAAQGDPSDWVEVKNTGTSEVSLTGVVLSQDVPATLMVPVGEGLADVLAAGAYKLVYLDDAAAFRLGAAETLHLVDADGNALDSVSWIDGDSPKGGSFGRIPDGTGTSKALGVPTPGEENDDTPAPECGDGARTLFEVCDGADLGAHACTTLGFSGGTLVCDADCLGVSTDACTFTTGDVVINELTSSGTDDIELFNTSASAVTITGYALFDTGYDPVADEGSSTDVETIGTFTLAAGAYLVLSKGDSHNIGVGDIDTLTLRDDDGNIVDRVSWTTGQAEVSYCRVPNGTGAFVTCPERTLGAVNVGP
jgi:hypothetical protein